MIQIPVWLAVLTGVLFVLILICGIINGYKWDSTAKELDIRKDQHKSDLGYKQSRIDNAEEALANIKKLAPNFYSLFDLVRVRPAYTQFNPYGYSTVCQEYTTHTWDYAKLARVAAKVSPANNDTDDTLELLNLGEF